MRRRIIAAASFAAAVLFLLAGCATIRHVDLEGMALPSLLELELAGRGPVPFTVEPGVRSGEYARRVEFEVLSPSDC